MASSTNGTNANDGRRRPSGAIQRLATNVRSSWLPQLARKSVADVVDPVFWRDVALEFIICSFVECCIIWLLTTLRPELYQISTTHLGLFVGFFVYAILAGYGPVNGALINPVCCWGIFLAGRMSAAKSKYYAELFYCARGVLFSSVTACSQRSL